MDGSIADLDLNSESLIIFRRRRRRRKECLFIEEKEEMSREGFKSVEKGDNNGVVELSQGRSEGA